MEECVSPIYEPYQRFLEEVRRDEEKLEEVYDVLSADFEVVVDVDSYEDYKSQFKRFMPEHKLRKFGRGSYVVKFKGYFVMRDRLISVKIFRVKYGFFLWVSSRFFDFAKDVEQLVRRYRAVAQGYHRYLFNADIPKDEINQVVNHIKKFVGEDKGLSLFDITLYFHRKEVMRWKKEMEDYYEYLRKCEELKQKKARW